LVGFYDKDGKYEEKIVVVVVKNYNNSMILEIIYYIVPIILGIEDLNPTYYFLFKLARYNRLIEMSLAVNNYIEYYGTNLNVIEIK
jgi:hypothetical protein